MNWGRLCVILIVVISLFQLVLDIQKTVGYDCHIGLDSFKWEETTCQEETTGNYGWWWNHYKGSLFIHSAITVTIFIAMCGPGILNPSG